MLISKSRQEGEPRFVRRDIVGPDGKTREGWELWLGDHCFGRADNKESLMRSLERQQRPPQSLHWREVHRQRIERDRGSREKENLSATEKETSRTV
ncbi:MAG: hypothetical protein AB7G75_12155 [Candidatus Binatia bacterium]